MSKNYLVIIFIILVIIACKKDTSPISAGFSGITETDEYNLILRDDPDDWQPRCRSGIPANFCILPAFPNPTDTAITFLFYLSSAAVVSIRIEDYPNRQIAFIEPAIYPAGLNKLNWSTLDSKGKDLTHGIYRAFIFINMNNGQYESYGDIQINNNI